MSFTQNMIHCTVLNCKTQFSCNNEVKCNIWDLWRRFFEKVYTFLKKVVFLTLTEIKRILLHSKAIIKNYAVYQKIAATSPRYSNFLHVCQISCKSVHAGRRYHVLRIVRKGQADSGTLKDLVPSV